MIDSSLFNVVTHLNGRLFDGSLGIKDRSVFNRTITLSAPNPTVDTTTYKYGGASLRFQGGPLGIAYDTPQAIGPTDEFGIQGWVNFSALGVSQIVMGRALANSYFPFQVWLNGANNKLGFRGYSNGQTLVYDLYSPTAMVAGQWVHFAAGRSGDTMSLWIDGSLAGSTVMSSGQSLYENATAPIYVGATGIGSAPLLGYLDDFQVVKGRPIATSPFSPPGELVAPDEIAEIRQPRLYETHVKVFAAAFPDANFRVFRDPPQIVRDMNYGGRGTVYGTVKNKGTPDSPVYRRVRLIRDRDGVCVRETWSNAVTGAYAFTNVDEAERYTVLSYDHTGNYRAVVADNLMAEVMQ